MRCAAYSALFAMLQLNVSATTDRNLIGFWLLGLVNNFSFVVFISAAEDLLPGFAGVILLCTILPGLVTKLTLPFWLHRAPYGLRVCTVAISVSGSMITVALSRSTTAKLVCLVAYSFLGALGEMTFLALSTFYPEASIGAWSSGTGMAGIAGAGAYYLLRQTLQFNATASLLALAVVPLGLIILFFLVLDGRHKVGSAYSSVVAQNGSVEETGSEGVLSVSHTKRELFPQLLQSFIMPLSAVYFGEYTINQGVLGTLTRFGGWHNKTLNGRDKSHRLYVWFNLMYQVGVFVSRSSIEFVRINSLWSLAALQLLNLVLLSFCSIYALLPSASVASLVIFWEGLLGGACYVNAFWKIRTAIPTEHREWAMATTTVGDSIGIALAALAGIWLEQLILQEQRKLG